MNILFFAHESRMGGANLSLLGMIDEMKTEHNLSVVVPIKEGFLVDELRKRKIPVYYRHSFWWMLAPASTPFGTMLKKLVYKVLCLNNYLCALSLRKVVRQQHIEIIHSNSGVLNTGGILASMTGIPHVWHLREFGQEDFGFFPVWKYERICRFIDRNSDKVIAISYAIAQKFREVITPEKVTVVYNGVDEKNIQGKTKEKNSQDKIEFLISSRVSKEKGQDEAVGALALLVEKGYQNVHLSIAGPGDISNLKAMIAEKNLEDYVSFLGFQSDMPAVRKNTDVELVCSVCEGFGRVTVEAMMSSSPVIGSDTGGTPELIRDGETGFLYEKGNVEQLAQKMETFIQQPELIYQMGSKACAYSEERFTKHRNAENVMEIYKELIYNVDKKRDER